MIYLLTIVVFSILFGFLVNAIGIEIPSLASGDACCADEAALPPVFKLVCAAILTILLLFALIMKLFEKFNHKVADPDTAVYTVEDMHCSHCEAAVVRAVKSVPGVESAKASAPANKLTVKGSASEADIRAAVEKTGYTFKGRKN